MPAAQEQKCIVLANGPSLKTSLEKHPDFFKKHPLVCVNTFAASELFTVLKPSYYVMIDPLFWKRETEAINETFKCLAEKTDWTLYLMVPKHAIKEKVFTDLKKRNSNIQLTPYNYTVFKGFSSIAHWFYKKNLAMPQSSNVTITSLFLSVNIGYKEVYLVGADHTWHENLHMGEDNVLYNKVTHFYENDTEVKYVRFYKGSMPENGTQKSYEFFTMWSKTFYGYFVVNDYAKKHNCQIYNASEVSFIDAFDRIKL